MTTSVMVIVAIAVVTAAFVQGTTGFGFALIVTPLLGLFAPHLLPVSVLVLMIPLNLYVLLREYGALDGYGFRRITVGRLVGTAGGLWVLIAVPASALNMLVGASTILAAALTIFLPPFLPRARTLVSAGVFTGVTETATGIGGPALTLVYQHRPAPVLRSTVALCFVVGQLISLIALAAAGRITTDQLYMAGILLPGLVLGGLLSRVTHHRVKGSLLRTLVLVFAIVSGAVLLLKG